MACLAQSSFPLPPRSEATLDLGTGATPHEFLWAEQFLGAWLELNAGRAEIERILGMAYEVHPANMHRDPRVLAGELWASFHRLRKEDSIGSC